MKILWVCNIALPSVAEREGMPKSNFGGWLVGLSGDLTKQENVNLICTFPNKKTVSGNVDGYRYRSFDSDTAENDFRQIISEEKPDIIHIFGTEFKHTLDCVNACESLGISDKVIINIQGLASVYAGHYFANLPYRAVKAKTLRDFLKNTNISKGAKLFAKRGKNEIEAVKKVSHIVGRTDWDKACTMWINPDAEYHFCNETLRSEFYRHKWSYDNCEKHSIFVSQCGYPIKGFHLVLEAMPMILSHYPDAKLYTTGKDLINIKCRDKLKLTYYQVYLRKLIKKYGLEDKVVFLGSLDEKSMCERYLKSNVFVSASSIENSPNSVGEAMVLGVPVVSSDVGGVKNMLEHNKEGFVYQADAPYMLAYYACELFGSGELAESFSKQAREHALQTHSREINADTMLEIYKKVSG